MSVQTLVQQRYPNYTPRTTGPGSSGLTPYSNPIAPPRVPVGGPVIGDGQASDTTTAIQTVADAYLAALGSQPEAAGATVVVPTPPIDGGSSSMNIKTIVLVAALAAAAWFLYKKFGPSSSAAA